MLDEYFKVASDLIISSSNMLPIDRRKYLNEIFNKIYNEIKKNNSLNAIIKISQLENKLIERMIDVNPILEASNEKTGTKKQVLEQIVYYSRKRFQDTYNCNIKIDSLRERSKDMNIILSEILNTLDITHIIINLGKKININDYYIGIVLIENDLYLFDLTYQQFFILGYNFINRFYEHPTGIKVCEIGGRMENRINTATTLIENGYLLCKSESFKEYMDALFEYANKKKLENYNSYLEYVLEEIKEIRDKNSNKILSNL